MREGGEERKRVKQDDVPSHGTKDVQAISFATFLHLLLAPRFSSWRKRLTHTRDGTEGKLISRLQDGCELGVAELMQDAVAGAALQRMQGNKFGRKGSGELARIKTSGPLTRARPPTQVFLRFKINCSLSFSLSLSQGCAPIFCPSIVSSRAVDGRNNTRLEPG